MMLKGVMGMSSAGAIVAGGDVVHQLDSPKPGKLLTVWTNV